MPAKAVVVSAILALVISPLGFAKCKPSYNGDDARVIKWEAPTENTDGGKLGKKELKRYHLYLVDVDADGKVTRELDEIAVAQRSDRSCKIKPVHRLQHHARGGKMHVAMRVSDRSGAFSDYSIPVVE